MIDLFIPSYHRPNNLATVKYFRKIGWAKENIHVFIDSEADDKEEYEHASNREGFILHIFDMDEARKRFDYVHRPSISRRSAGQARNMFQDFAKENGISFYVVQDDDTHSFEIKRHGRNVRTANKRDVVYTFEAIKEWMTRRRVGCFGVSQSGDFIGGNNDKIFRKKVMNTTFYDTRFVYRGERGVQDNDTSQFVGMMNEGFFVGSLGDGLCLHQQPSAKNAGGLTDLYNECKLLNKSLVCPIQYPSAIYAERQRKNGGRLHHHICARYIMPCILKNEGGRDNIAWDTYPEDYPFTNEKVFLSD